MTQQTSENPRDEFVSRGILTGPIKTKLVIFVAVTLLGVSYLSANYIGIGRGLFGSNACTVSADFPDSGGIFTNAEVTYRGVTVGEVKQLTLIDNGVRVELGLNNCSNPKIPASASAHISDRSVIGEQYVNLIPPNDNGPYLSGGQIIPMSRNTVPVAVETILGNVDRLVRSVDLRALATTVDELGQAFNGQGPSLAKLLESTDLLVTEAKRNLPVTLALIQQAAPVLQTQLDEQPALASFTHSLNLLSQQLKASDGDLRTLLTNGPSDLGVLRAFIADNQSDLGVTLANLATTGDLLVRHRDGVEQILELYPVLATGAMYVVQPTTGTSRLGFVLNVNDPPDCGSPGAGRQGYEQTNVRPPANTAPQAPNVAAHCTAPASSGTNVRGSANVPGGDPLTPSGGGVAYPRATTSDTVRIGSLTGTSAPTDGSWIYVLTNGLN